MVKLEGDLVSWNEAKGFGFIRPQEGGRDVFVHRRNLWPRSRLPQVGERVFYALELDREGRPRAVEASIGSPRQHRSALSSAVGLPRVVLALIPFAGGLYVGRQTWLPLGIYLFMSSICFLHYYFDKQMAKLGGWRTREITLHLWELGGGWPGALIAQGLFRHKTRKAPFQTVFWGIVLLHLLLWFDYLVLDGALTASLIAL